jgi:transposase
MLGCEEFSGIYLHRVPVDFRKSINGLSAIVQEEMKLNAFEKFLFVFINQDRNRMKILYWDRTGFVLWLKRLEKQKFPWPRKLEEDVVTLSSKELKWILDGYDIFSIKPHETLEFSCTT